MIKLTLICFIILSTSVAKSQTMPAPENDSTIIAFASDTQAPMWVETLWLRSNNNRTATRMIFGDIAQRNPRCLFLLGDVVNLGYSNKQWKPMDKYLAALRDKKIDVHAILGNHEVMGQPIKGQKKFQKRFPTHVATGYMEVIDSVAVVMLNSNFGTLSASDNKKQEDWYKETIEKLDADPSILFIVTGCHHSPFTNSKIVGSNTEVQQKFVPVFLKSAKSKIFLSGHSHNFEHYQIGGKDFFVIGGGGGLHQPLRQGVGILPDLAKDYKPLFHYLTIKRKKDCLELTSYELNNKFDGFQEGLAMEVKMHVSTDIAQTVK